jgi:hypothetical protein
VLRSVSPLEQLTGARLEHAVASCAVEAARWRLRRREEAARRQVAAGR